MRRCERCGEPDTGWPAAVRGGRRICPACAAGVQARGVREELAERRALLARLEADFKPENEKLAHDVRLSVERLERRAKMRPVDADALIAEYDRVHVGPPGGARKLMEDAPTLDVAPVVHARWIPHIDDDGRRYGHNCSECGAWLVMVDKINKYCCDCGAKMDEGVEEDDHQGDQKGAGEADEG